MVQFLKVPVNGNQMNFENQMIPAMNYMYLFSEYLSVAIDRYFYEVFECNITSDWLNRTV